MKRILTIHYHEFLLPESANINELLKTLGKCVLVESQYHDGKYYYTEKESPDIEVKMVPENQFGKPKKPKQIAASASPDAHGENFTQTDLDNQ